jgi:hypothetical protein
MIDRLSAHRTAPCLSTRTQLLRTAGSVISLKILCSIIVKINVFIVLHDSNLGFIFYIIVFFKIHLISCKRVDPKLKIMRCGKHIYLQQCHTAFFSPAQFLEKETERLVNQYRARIHVLRSVQGSVLAELGGTAHMLAAGFAALSARGFPLAHPPRVSWHWPGPPTAENDGDMCSLPLNYVQRVIRRSMPSPTPPRPRRGKHRAIA